MECGNIIESGNHNDLIAQNGMYKRLVDAQTLIKESSDLQANVSFHELKDKKVQIVDSSRKSISPSFKSDVETGNDRKISAIQVFLRILRLNAPESKYIIPGFIAAIGAGLVYPFFAIVFANIIQVFSKTGQQLYDGASFWVTIFLLDALDCIGHHVYRHCIRNLHFKLFNEHFLWTRFRATNRTNKNQSILIHFESRCFLF